MVRKASNLKGKLYIHHSFRIPDYSMMEYERK